MSTSLIVSSSHLSVVGIVITLAGEHWRGFGIRTITINEGSLLALTSVFPLELTGAVVAIKIAAAINCAPCRVTKTNGYFTLVNFVQGVHIKQSLSRATPPPHGKENYYASPPIENASITF